MAFNEILLLQDRLYEYLKKKHKENPKLLFELRYQEGEIGYWFSGSPDTVHITFWSEPVAAHYEIYYDAVVKRWTCALREGSGTEAADTELSSFGFERVADSYWTRKKEIGVTADFIEPLSTFLQNDKPRIEALLVQQTEKGNKEHWLRIKKLKEHFKQTVLKIEAFKKSAAGKIYGQLLLEMSKPRLPFALSGLEIYDFQGIKHLVIENIPLNAPWIFLTGENSFGKTSILRAIAKGVLGDEDFVEPLPQGSVIRVSGCHGDEPFLSTLSHQTADSAKDVRFRSKKDFQMATYGISRFRYNNDPDKNPPKTLALFSDEAPMINIERILIETHRAKMDGEETGNMTTFDKLKQVFLRVIPQLSDIRVEYFKNEPITTRYQVRYYEKAVDNDRYTYAPIKRDNLAAGYRSILSIIGDMMVRLSAHPNNSLEDLQGMVLIDEIDAHLHPKYQYELPKLLSETFPKVQFIVTTHSPIPILGLPETMNLIVFKVNRTAKEGISVKRLDNEIAIRRLSANALLTSDVFGFDTIFARGATPDTIEPFDNYKEIQEMSEIEKSLMLKEGFKKLRIKI